MKLAPGDVTEDGWTVGYLAIWHERRGIQIKLAEGLIEGLKDDLGRRFSRSIYYEFYKGPLRRIWIPCFVSWESFDFEHQGISRPWQYFNIYCVPQDVADRNFKRQYADIFGASPEDVAVEQFWSDIFFAVDVFLQYARDRYERSVPNPRPARLILFEWGRDVTNWLEAFPKIGASAAEVIQAARKD